MRLQAVSETRSSSASGRRDIRPERIAVTTRDRARYSGILKSGGRIREAVQARTPVFETHETVASPRTRCERMLKV